MSSLVSTSTEQNHLMHNQESRRHNPHGGITGASNAAASGGTTVTWASPPNQATEIDRIMAKIEQARLSIANVCVTGYHKETFYFKFSSSIRHLTNFWFSS